MNSARETLSACVVKGLPSARDYAYKDGEMLLEKKRQREMADTEQYLEESNDERSCIHFLYPLVVGLHKMFRKLIFPLRD
jgi:hypothetical protein